MKNTVIWYPVCFTNFVKSNDMTRDFLKIILDLLNAKQVGFTYN